MSLPPADVAPSELLLRLIERPAPNEIFEFRTRGPNGGAVELIRILVLSGETHELCRIKSLKYLRESRKMSDADLASPLGVEMLGDATARECIAMACHLPDIVPGTEDSPRYARLFRGAADVNKLPADDIATLFGAYCLVQKKFGPYERSLSDGEVNAWIERLVRGASTLPLSQLGLPLLAELAMSLAQRAWSFSSFLESLPESSRESLESIPETWSFGTSSSFAPAADSTQSSSDERPAPEPLTMEQAMAAAEKLRRLE
jgi:hypothetical protein